MNILCFGDSNTYGYMPGGWGRFDESTRFTGILAQLLGPEHTVYEDGLCGRTTVFDEDDFPGRMGIDAISDSVRTSAADLLFLMLGTNDCKKRFAADTEMITAGIVRIGEAAKATRPGIRVLLCSPIMIQPFALTHADYFSPASIETCRELAAAYKKAAATHGYDFMDAAEFAVADSEDGEHMNPDGHAALAKAVYDKLVTII
jgi:lysophospholipase L1-like esterase